MLRLRPLQERGEQAAFGQADHDVVPHADLVEEPHLLKGPGDPVVGRIVRLQNTDADRVDDDDAFVEGQHPAQQVYQGRLARAVRPDDARDPLPEDGHRELVHGSNRAKALRNRLRLQGEDAGIDFGSHSLNFPTRPCGLNNIINTSKIPSTTCRA